MYYARMVSRGVYVLLGEKRVAEQGKPLLRQIPMLMLDIVDDDNDDGSAQVLGDKELITNNSTHEHRYRVVINHGVELPRFVPTLRGNERVTGQGGIDFRAVCYNRNTSELFVMEKLFVTHVDVSFADSERHSSDLESMLKGLSSKHYPTLRK